MARFLGLFGATALSFACGGCSFLFADPPPTNHEKMVYFDCTSTPGLEVADGVMTLIIGAGAVDTISTPEKKFERENDGGDRNTAAGIGFVTAAVLAGSAVYGIVVTENCNDAKENLRQRIVERERRRARLPVAPAGPPALVTPPTAPPPPASTTPVVPSTRGDTAPPPPEAPPSEAPPPTAPAPAF